MSASAGSVVEQLVIELVGAICDGRNEAMLRALQDNLEGLLESPSIQLSHEQKESLLDAYLTRTGANAGSDLLQLEADIDDEDPSEVAAAKILARLGVIVFFNGGVHDDSVDFGNFDDLIRIYSKGGASEFNPEDFDLHRKVESGKGACYAGYEIARVVEKDERVVSSVYLDTENGVWVLRSRFEGRFVVTDESEFLFDEEESDVVTVTRLRVTGILPEYCDDMGLNLPTIFLKATFRDIGANESTYKMIDWAIQ